MLASEVLCVCACVNHSVIKIFEVELYHTIVLERQGLGRGSHCHTLGKHRSPVVELLLDPTQLRFPSQRLRHCFFVVDIVAEMKPSQRRSTPTENSEGLTSMNRSAHAVSC